MVKVLEILAFAVSAAAFGYGAFHLFREEIPKFFRLYACAAGCYMLEELWVIVNSLLGSGAQDGLVTVRLVGFFGCLCFLLSANASDYDRVVDDGKNRKQRAAALLAPAILLALYGAYAFSPVNPEPFVSNVTGLLSLSPALFAAYFCLKHRLLPADAMGFLAVTRGLDHLALTFFAVNFAYPLANLYCPAEVMGICDVLLAVILLGMMLLCRKGAKRWTALI